MTGKKLGDQERPRLGNDIFQHPHLPKVHPVDPADGMPRPDSAVSMTDSLAPKLAVETMVCMEDASTYVVRDEWGKVLLSIEPDRVKSYSDERGDVWVAALSENERARSNHPHVWAGGHDFWYVVEPFRTQCEHYRRVMLDFEGSDTAKHVERSCTAQRTEGGEYISLADTRVYACEHRSPRDFVSEQRLRRFDTEQIKRTQEAEAEYDVGAALAAMKENGNG